jgi:hypothetical protein
MMPKNGKWRARPITLNTKTRKGPTVDRVSFEVRIQGLETEWQEDQAENAYDVSETYIICRLGESGRIGSRVDADSGTRATIAAMKPEIGKAGTQMRKRF